MTLPVVLAAGLLLALCGLGLVRTAPAAARWLALLVVLAFTIVAGISDRTAERRVEPRLEQVALVGEAEQQRTAMLRAAARSGPRAQELALRWEASGSGAAPDAALGAVTSLPASMPFAPADVRIRAAARVEADRPALLEIDVADLEEEVAAEMVVRDRDGEILRQAVVVGRDPTSITFTPVRAGRYEATLQVVVGAHRVLASGGFDVEAPQEILVVEPTGVVAAALRAQGERVRAVRAWPADWRRHRRVVLGQDLAVEDQQDLVEAVRDGVGLFVLGAAFGPEGAPLRAILPVRPLPEQPDEGDGDGRGSASDEQPEQPEANEPPPEQPPPTPPEKIGDTEGAKPISKDPIEVDKHAIAMVLVVDRSGSMSTRLPEGVTKMSYAKTSALRTAQALGRGDLVGLVTFGDPGAGRIELPLTDATRSEVVRAGIEELAGQPERTFLLSGLRSAHAQLRDAEAAVKHVVVLTDGEFQMGQMLALSREAHLMRTRSKITVSIISIVDPQTDPDFKVKARDIARDGGGAFVATGKARSVPVLVSSEVTRALSRVGRKPNVPGEDPDQPAPEEEPKPEPPPPEPEQPDPPPPERPEAPRALPVFSVVESPLLQPEPLDWPTLGSAVVCEAPLDSRVLLVVGEQGWPLLTFANRGLGRVGAFAADLGGASGREFRQADAFPAWIAQWLAATSAAEQSVEAEDVRDEGEVTPPAPVPQDVDYLAALGGGAPGSAEDPEIEPTAVVGSVVVQQVSRLAPWLLPLLLLLAVVERWLAARELRRGRT